LKESGWLVINIDEAMNGSRLLEGAGSVWGQAVNFARGKTLYRKKCNLPVRQFGAFFAAASLMSMSALAGDTVIELFGDGELEFPIVFVVIGEIGNNGDTEGDPNPCGSVAYGYRIGKYEISELQIDKAVAGGAWNINYARHGPDKPATSISWLEAAIFVNWLNESTGHPPAYKLIPPVPPFTSPTFHLWEPNDPGYDPLNPYRNRRARYVIPSSDEWYKAAFFNPDIGLYRDFPTGFDSAPQAVPGGTTPNTAVFNQAHYSTPADVSQAGGLSPFGTMGQGGNVFEWNESPYFGDFQDPHATRVYRGGDFSSYGGGVNDLKRIRRYGWSIWGGGATWGLRVASVLTCCGDLDLEGDIDLGDFALFGDCVGGPDIAPPLGCTSATIADLDGDDDVDLGDFARFQWNFGS
jgi:formylglycine-generating enzyme required for sulfatase activity